MADKSKNLLVPEMFDELEPHVFDPDSESAPAWDEAWGPEPTDEELASPEFDAELAELFAGMDDVKLTDELFERALDVIAPKLHIAQVEGVDAQAEGEDVGAEDDDAEAEQHAMSSDVEVTRVMPPVGSRTDAQAGSEGLTSRTTPRRRRSFAPFVVAAALVLALLGAFAWMTPTTYVTLSRGGSSIQLGVNMFGTTVTAVAEGDDAREMLSEVDVINRGFEDSVRALVTEFDQRNPLEESSVRLEVSGGLFPDQRQRVEEGADRVLTELAGNPAFRSDMTEVGAEGVVPNGTGLGPAEPELQDRFEPQALDNPAPQMNGGGPVQADPPESQDVVAQDIPSDVQSGDPRETPQRQPQATQGGQEESSSGQIQQQPGQTGQGQAQPSQSQPAPTASSNHPSRAPEQGQSNTQLVFQGNGD